MSYLVITIALILLLVAGISHAGQAGDSAFTGEQLYRHYCTPCHGMKGDGKGFNAINLDPRPANHTDAELMRRRSDRDVFSAISGGGRAVGKAALMPPWGDTLNDKQIRSLVRYLRKLCRCTERGSEEL